MLRVVGRHMPRAIFIALHTALSNRVQASCHGCVFLLRHRGSSPNSAATFALTGLLHSIIIIGDRVVVSETSAVLCGSACVEPPAATELKMELKTWDPGLIGAGAVLVHSML